MDEGQGSGLSVMPPVHAMKVKPSHLERANHIYVRQSTMHQVVQNTESSERQYGLQQRAVALGWPVERVHIIDSYVRTMDREKRRRRTVPDSRSW